MLTKIHCTAVLKLITKVFLDGGCPLKALRKEFIYTVVDYDILLCVWLLHSVPENGRS